PTSTDITTLSLHDALPIFNVPGASVVNLHAPVTSHQAVTVERLDGSVRILKRRCCWSHQQERSPPVFSRLAVGQPGVTATRNVQDRKSTRLNSSHVAISYA